ITCLVAKATEDETVLWHRRLGHVNFKWPLLDDYKKGKKIRDLQLIILCGGMFKEILSQGEALKIVSFMETVL
ncbi:ribonuclease H-like domain-containing protein, partial [Tanacetum coccineum]